MASFKSTLNWVYVVLIAAQIIGMFGKPPLSPNSHRDTNALNRSAC